MLEKQWLIPKLESQGTISKMLRKHTAIETYLTPRAAPVA